MIGGPQIASVLLVTKGSSSAALVLASQAVLGRVKSYDGVGDLGDGGLSAT